MSEQLVAFLRARLAEDEATARAATAGPWWLIQNHFEGDNSVQIRSALTELDAVHGQWMLVARLTAQPDTPVTRRRMSADSVFLESMHPGRVLADLEAKRTVVDLCERVAGADARAADVSRRERRHAVDLLRALAVVYRHHPQFDPDWLDEEQRAVHEGRAAADRSADGVAGDGTEAPRGSHAAPCEPA